MIRNPFTIFGLGGLREALFQAPLPFDPRNMRGGGASKRPMNQRMILAHRKKRKAKLKTKRAMRRQRALRGQNLRTGKAA